MDSALFKFPRAGNAGLSTASPYGHDAAQLMQPQARILQDDFVGRGKGSLLSAG
eukprot:CAMPEP_0196721110 /NCGR_PEP_ID=MMETSP1091-20130531/3768_1 /TAXON_ID=302021 /ORGANISM="Rhodomonas sp., Strain CCMP768" /LENGTH=53 /DNA_ID=CAMNT_0042062509 /DNA_START=130 /DNA_END=288 /DNA_ORIENTATION=-